VLPFSLRTFHLALLLPSYAAWTAPPWRITSRRVLSDSPAACATPVSCILFCLCTTTKRRWRNTAPPRYARADLVNSYARATRPPRLPCMTRYYLCYAPDRRQAAFLGSLFPSAFIPAGLCRTWCARIFHWTAKRDRTGGYFCFAVACCRLYCLVAAGSAAGLAVALWL